ncbi:MAG: Uma2 family endonuclease [Anaerolinea sp.]|nr:Uma2 family endonuclease [Anaerolinea sp.]
MTAAQNVPVRVDLAAYRRAADEAARAGRILELIDGELVEKMPSFTPSRIAARISFFLMQYLMERDLGYVTGADGGYVLNEGNVFIPDVGFITRARLPEAPAREAPVPPDLAVEVKSPTDTIRELRRKAEQYLAAGTRLVWLVFPDDRRVEVYDGDADVITLSDGDTLTGGALLPGFTLSVRDIFA